MLHQFYYTGKIRRWRITDEVANAVKPPHAYISVGREDQLHPTPFYNAGTNVFFLEYGRSLVARLITADAPCWLLVP